MLGIIWNVIIPIDFLVGGLEHFLFFHVLGMSSSQLTNSNLFQRSLFNHQQGVDSAGATLHPGAEAAGDRLLPEGEKGAKMGIEQ